MLQSNNRRKFLRSSALGLTIPAFMQDALAQKNLQRRLDWEAFKVTTQYDSLLNAIRRMKANTNPADPNSWEYWTAVHINHCPHNVPYFYAWHRGYLYYFERQLKTVSGDSRLALPYWDYYASPALPAEFTNASTTNPLYVERVNTDVRQALTLAPFSPTLTNFPRGMVNAFEPSLESAPHNPVHDIIGNTMATMRSPVDPIFWLHHANVDRLWVAWVAAGGGRTMPSKKSAYWSGNHVYASTLSMARSATYDTRSVLQYSYQNESLPTRLPLAQLSPAKIHRVQAEPGQRLATLPPLGTFPVTAARATSETRFSIGGARRIGLDERSISAQLPVSSSHWKALQEIMRGNAASVPGSSKQYRSVVLVLDEVELSEGGRKGGFYYQVYLNIPADGGPSSTPISVLIGTLGAFQVSGASHHGHGSVQLAYPIGRKLAGASSLQVGLASVSFVRVNGSKAPRGPAIGIGEVRIELATEDSQS